MYVIFLKCTYCVQKSLTVSCTLLCECGDRVKVDQSSFSALLCECGDRVKVDQSSFSADLHAVMLRHHCSEFVCNAIMNKRHQ